MNLTYIDNYWDDPELKRKFIDFLIEIFGLDLSLWDRMGFWDNNYRPFSFFEGDRLVSSLCLYSLDMMIAGKLCRVAQVSGVGTLPEYRRQGLNSELTRKALAWAQDHHDFFFLFADEEAYPFYESCGFRRADEHQVSISVTGESALPGAEKLDIRNQDHLELICRCAAEREQVSDELGVLSQKLFLFWYLYFLRENIYYIADLDVLVPFKREKGLLTIFDIVGRKLPTFIEVYPYIRSESDKTIEFLFMVDKMNLSGSVRIETRDTGLHLLGDFPLQGTQFIFPCTAHA